MKTGFDKWHVATKELTEPFPGDDVWVSDLKKEGPFENKLPELPETKRTQTLLLLNIQIEEDEVTLIQHMFTSTMMWWMFLFMLWNWLKWQNNDNTITVKSKFI